MFYHSRFLPIALSFVLATSLLLATSVQAGNNANLSRSASVSTLAQSPVLVQPPAPTIISATLNAGVLSVAGTAQSGVTINLYDLSLHLLGTTTADVNGKFSLTTSNTSGITPSVSTVTTTATLCVLNNCLTSLPSQAVIVLGSGVPTPSTPTLPTPPTIISATLNAGVLLMAGTATPNATVSIYDANSHLLGTTTADVNGKFTLSTTNTSGMLPNVSTVAGTTTVCVANNCLVSLVGAPVIVVGGGNSIPTPSVTPPTTSSPTVTSGATLTPTPSAATITATPTPSVTFTPPSGTPPASTTTPVGSATPSPTGGTNGGSNSHIYYLPFLANNYNSFTTFVAVQGNAANFTFSAFDTQGSNLGSAALNHTAPNGENILTNPMSNGTRGSGIIVSDQPLNIVVAEATPFGGSAYTVPEGSNTVLVAPIALNNAYGGFTTQLNVSNVSSQQNNVVITFYSHDGTALSTQSLSMGGHSTQTLDQANLPNGFNGWAIVQGSDQLVGQVLEQNPNNHFVAIMNAQTSSNKTLYGPAIFNNAFGGFYTGANLVNPGSTSANVTLTYHDNTGKIYNGGNVTMPAHTTLGVYQASASGVGIPAGGLPLNFYGSLEVDSDNAVILVVNETGGLTATGNARSGTYAAAASGVSSLTLPVMANGAYGGYVTGATLLNTSSGPVGGTIQYYSLDGTPQGGPENFSIAAYSSYAEYQGDKVANGFFGSAVINQTTGVANSLISTANAQSSSFFYTYTEPTK